LIAGCFQKLHSVSVQAFCEEPQSFEVLVIEIITDIVVERVNAMTYQRCLS